MRTYSELSPKEKDKFKTYQIIKEAWSLQQVIVLVIVYVGIFIGVPLLMIPSYALNVAGALVLTLSAALLVAVIYVIILLSSLSLFVHVYIIGSDAETFRAIRLTDAQLYKKGPGGPLYLRR